MLKKTPQAFSVLSVSLIHRNLGILFSSGKTQGQIKILIQWNVLSDLERLWLTSCLNFKACLWQLHIQVCKDSWNLFFIIMEMQKRPLFVTFFFPHLLFNSSKPLVPFRDFAIHFTGLSPPKFSMYFSLNNTKNYVNWARCTFLII